MKGLVISNNIANLMKDLFNLQVEEAVTYFKQRS